MHCIPQHCKLKEIHNYLTITHATSCNKSIIEQHQHRTTHIRIDHYHLLPAPTSRCTNINKSARKPPARERCVGLGSVSAREDLTDCPERAGRALPKPPPWRLRSMCSKNIACIYCCLKIILVLLYSLLCIWMLHTIQRSKAETCSAKSSLNITCKNSLRIFMDLGAYEGPSGKLHAGSFKFLRSIGIAD